ncbi:hypothetical protein [Psychrobacter sp. I-STPA6b]|uniref:hypothetical protein n=1 Tax=Psychrobacter sp. I-STPA6b TaxID=2585718 RepID=UPI001D0CC093|nr:hypothetical protein [Psychrobacter sp. I-STPA6b]
MDTSTVSHENIVETLLDMGLKVWEKGSVKRIYMTCEQFNKITNNDYNLNDNNNKIFYDFKKNAILRSYKGKKAKLEFQY